MGVKCSIIIVCILFIPKTAKAQNDGLIKTFAKVGMGILAKEDFYGEINQVVVIHFDKFQCYHVSEILEWKEIDTSRVEKNGRHLLYYQITEVVKKRDKQKIIAELSTNNESDPYLKLLSSG